MEIAIIAAIGRNNELGKNNNLIWHFHEDMHFFKNLTLNSSVIMGRKTFESLPHALPQRENIVISHNSSFSAKNIKCAATKDEALSLCNNDMIFIIGGAQIYGEFIELANKIYLTEINATEKNADVYFPDFDKSKYTRTTLSKESENGIEFTHVLYEKK